MLLKAPSLKDQRFPSFRHYRLGNPRWQGRRGFFWYEEMADPKSEAAEMIGLAELIAQAGDRIQYASIGGRKVWIKKAVKQPHAGHYLQMLASLAMPGSIYRPSPPEVGEAASRGEAERLRAFQAKGMATPDILYEGPGVLVLADCGPTVEERLLDLRELGQAEAHDALLLAMVRGMGVAHAAGLVHGRPHPRDMFVRDDRIGFMDFEQNPLQVMSLARAQTRDVLILFGFVCDLAMKPETSAQAWNIWTAKVSPASRKQLAQTLSGIRPLVAVARLAARFKLGSDLRRFLASTGFLLSKTDEHQRTKTRGEPGRRDAAAESSQEKMDG